MSEMTQKVKVRGQVSHLDLLTCKVPRGPKECVYRCLEAISLIPNEYKRF